MDGGRKTGAEEAQKGAQEQSLQEEEEEEMAGALLGPFRGGKGREQQQEQEQEQEERLSKEWEEAKRWSKMDQLARELAAEKRLAGEDVEDDDPDRSMQLSYQARGYGFRGPRLRGWRPSPQEDTVEAGLPLRGHRYPEEKKEEEGSANRRPEVGTGRSQPQARPSGVGPAEGQWPPDMCVWLLLHEGTPSPGSLGWRGAPTGSSGRLSGDLGRGRREGASGRKAGDLAHSGHPVRPVGRQTAQGECSDQRV